MRRPSDCRRCESRARERELRWGGLSATVRRTGGFGLGEEGGRQSSCLCRRPTSPPSPLLQERFDLDVRAQRRSAWRDAPPLLRIRLYVAEYEVRAMEKIESEVLRLPKLLLWNFLDWLISRMSRPSAMKRHRFLILPFPSVVTVFWKGRLYTYRQNI